MADISKLSDNDLKALYAITKNETNAAPDSSGITNPDSGAMSSMQVVKGTRTDPGFGVKPSNGTPQDTAREGADYYLAMQQKYKDPMTAAIAYNWGPGNTDKWLASGGDLSKLPDETLKYAYNYNRQNPTDPTTLQQKVDSPSDLSKMSDDQLKQMYQQQQAPSAAQQRGKAALAAMKPDTTAIGNAVTGTGELAASMASGMFGSAAGALHGAADLATGSTYAQAKQDFHNDTDAVTYQPRTQAGQDIAKNVGEMFDKYLVGPARIGAQTAMSAIPFVGEDLAKSPLANEIAGDVGEVTANLLPMAFGGKAAIEKGKGATEVKMPEATGELDKMNNLNQGQGPEMPPNMGPQQPSFGDVPYRQYFEQPDLFDKQSDGMSPQGPGLGLRPDVDPNAAVDNTRGSLSNKRQMDLQLDQGEPLRVSPEGEVFPESAAPLRDAMQERVEKLKMLEPEQMDMFDAMDQQHFDQFSSKEAPRTLSPDEFRDVATNLAEKDGTRFPIPEDMEAAYSHYLDTVRTDQGGLFDRATIAKNFAEAAAKEAIDRRISDHPIVKANQARVDRLEAALAEAGDKAPKGYTALEDARRTLEKSKENIGKTLGADPTLPWERDGTVHMYTFGNLPEMFRSIKAILQALHNVAFKMIDRMIPRQRNLDGPRSILMQGMKDAANARANKEWAQTVNEQPKKVLDGVPGLREGLKDYLPYEAREDISPEALKQQMQEAPDLAAGDVKGALRNQLLTGQQLQAFTHHPLVKYAVETVDRAMRDSQRFVREQLVGKNGLREKIRAMSQDELTGVWSLMEMNEGVREFSDAELKGAGYSDKQVEFYRKRMELNDQKYQALNEGRAQAGLKPVDRRIAHIAGHFLGDFKTIIKDADGKVKAVIAHNNRGAVKTIANRVLEQLGEGHTMSPIEMRKLSETGSTDRYTGYMNILNDMADRDPVISQVVDAYKSYMANDAQTAMRYRAAYKSKDGVMGAEGRKSWQSAAQNAKDGVKNELKSLEAMNTWSEMQKALSKIKEFQADPDINAPVAKSAVQSYLDNVQRRNQGKVAAGVNYLVNGVAEATGVGPSTLKHISNVGKEGLLTMFIGLGKLSHSFVTLIQPLQGIPVVNSLMKAEGSKLGLSQLTAAVKSFGTQGQILEALAKGGDVKDPFLRKALQFAKENDTFNSSQFQFGNLTDTSSKSLVRNFKRVAEFNVTGMESATRSFTYMYYAHMLKDLGMKESEIFPTAHNAMKDVMVDYNSWERPGVFGKLGFLGDLTAMLTRYKFNQIDQFARGSKYMMNGKIGPMATILATSIAAAGVRGLMAYTIANQLVAATTTWAASNNLMQKPTSIDELLLHMLHGKNENLSNALKFGMPSALGINMTGSLSHADDIPNDPLGSLVPQSEPIMDMGKALYNFARDPNKATAKTMAYDLSPNSAKGFIENHLFTDDKGKFTNPHSFELQTRRSPADQLKRELGFRPLHEAQEALTSRVSADQKEHEGEVRQATLARILRDVDSNHGVTPELSRKLREDYAPKFVANNGDPREIANAIVLHQGLGQNRTALERTQGMARSGLSSIFNYQRVEDLK